MSRPSTAHHFLEGLLDLGVECIFANLGTDHVSLIEELARWDQEGRKHPEYRPAPTPTLPRKREREQTASGLQGG